MKKKFGSLFLTCLMVVIFTMGVFAAGAAKEIKAILRQDATFSIEGKAKTYKDKDGKALYPIEYNGRVYLPAEAVQGITGKTVKWDSKAAKLDITAKKDTASSSSVETTKSSAKTIKFDDLEIKVGTKLRWDKLSNQFSDYHGATVFAVPLTIKNLKSETHGLNMFYYRQYGPKGTELASVRAYFDDDVMSAGKMRPNASVNTYMYFLYDGDGDYYIEFDNFGQKVEVKVSVKK